MPNDPTNPASADEQMSSTPGESEPRNQRIVAALRRDVERLRTTIEAKKRRGHPVPQSFYDDLDRAEQRLVTASGEQS